MPLHICNVLFSKQLSHRQWQFIFLCLLSFVEYPIQFVIMKCLSWLSGDSSLFHNDRGTWKMLLRLTRGIHRQCFNLHVMSRADLLSTSLPSRPSVVRKAFSGMAVRCICGPSGRGNALGQLYIPWPQAAFVDWFSYTMHNLHNWTSLHMEPTDHKWAFFFPPKTSSSPSTCTPCFAARSNACGLFLPCLHVFTVHSGSVCVCAKLQNEQWYELWVRDTLQTYSGA